MTSEQYTKLIGSLPATHPARRAAGPAAAAGPKRSKYGAQRVIVDGYRFDSKREARRYEALKQLRAAGQVRWFALQPQFLLPAGVIYRADFIVAWADGRVSVEDVKSGGTRTAVYRMKKKQAQACCGIEIDEV